MTKDNQGMKKRLKVKANNIQPKALASIHISKQSDGMMLTTRSNAYTQKESK